MTEGESSRTWHTGYGGGVMLQLIGTPMAAGASIASGSEGIRFYFAGGAPRASASRPASELAHRAWEWPPGSGSGRRASGRSRGTGAAP